MSQILVVDDLPEIRRLARRILEGAGHKVSESADGAGALRMLEHDRPDTVIADLHMPGLDGFELIRRMRKLPTAPRIVVISGTGPGAYLDMALEMGAAVTLSKPFTSAELLAAVSPGLESQAAI